MCVHPADGGLRGSGGSVRGGEPAREGRRGLETEGNNSETCTGNTSIFSTSPQRAEQRHELNDFCHGEWEWRGVLENTDK